LIDFSALKDLLEEKVETYNQPGFIADDPISIPHLFKRKEDIEIMGFWAAVLAWGQRKTIINKSKELIRFMDNAPYDFIMHHKDKDLKRFLNFCHRTFNATDALYFIAFFRSFYAENKSLETAFSRFLLPDDTNVENALSGFHALFFSLPDYPSRTRKHIATPVRKSTCKRLNMFLRWMVRKDGKGVDFGIWETIGMEQLVCPCDVHVDRIARRFKLLTRKQTDWKAAVELTENLKLFDPKDPVKYDFALFGIGVGEKYLLSK